MVNNKKKSLSYMQIVAKDGVPTKVPRTFRPGSGKGNLSDDNGDGNENVKNNRRL